MPRVDFSGGGGNSGGTLPIKASNTREQHNFSSLQLASIVELRNRRVMSRRIVNPSDSLDHQFGTLDMNVMIAANSDDPGGIGGEMAQFHLHLIPDDLSLCHVGRGTPSCSVMTKYYQRQTPEGVHSPFLNIIPTGSK